AGVSPASFRFNTTTAAKPIAATIGRSAPGLNTSAPGRSTKRTPAKPTATAAQRRGATRSPRKIAEKAGVKSGLVKRRDEAEANGRKSSPREKATAMKAGEERGER